MTSRQTHRHIEIARELSRDLRSAAGRFDELALRELDKTAFWGALQLDDELVAQFRGLLEMLWLDGIKSRYFAGFDASKLILPLAAEIADRLDALADELETKAKAPDGDGALTYHRSVAELRMQN